MPESVCSLHQKIRNNPIKTTFPNSITMPKIPENNQEKMLHFTKDKNEKTNKKNNEKRR